MKAANLLGNLLGLVRSLGELNVLPHLSVRVHELEETVTLNVDLRKKQVCQLVSPAISSLNFQTSVPYKLKGLVGDVGNVHVVGGRGEIFQLLVGEDVDGDQVDLGVTVLAGLRGRHVDDLARTALDDDVTTLPQCRTLHGVGRRRAGVGRVEGVLMLKIRDKKELVTPL